MENVSPEILEKVNHWLSGNYDEDTKSEIRQMMEENQATALTDAFYKDLEFGTGGLRGKMGVGSNRINQYTVGAATQGLANYLKKSFPNETVKVAIAHDSRNRSAEFAQITANVFSANGIEVYLFEELRPTPELSFAVRHFGCKSGVVITASHNPKEYNGYKAYWDDGAQVVPPHDKNIIAEVQQVKIDDIQFEAKEQLIHKIGEEVDKVYLDQVKSLSLNPGAIQNQKDLKIVFTSIHGTAVTLVPQLLKGMGFENVHNLEEQANPDGNFPTVVYPNPEEAEALSIGLKKAEELDADILMGTDPDADRVGIAVKNHHGQWQLLNGNQTGALLVYYLINAWKENGKLQGKEYIAKTIVTSDLLDEIAHKNQVEVFNTLTGFKYIAEILRQEEGKKLFIGGGEESYGYLAGEFVRDKDAVMACGLIAEMAAYYKDQGKSLFETLIAMYQEYGFYYEKLISIKKEGKAGAEEIQAMMQSFRDNPPQNLAGSPVIMVKDYKSSVAKNLKSGEESAISLSKSNVLQFFTEDGTKVSARPSGTEPKIKFYFSVKGSLASPEAFDATHEALNQKIDQIIQDLELK